MNTQHLNFMGRAMLLDNSTSWVPYSGNIRSPNENIFVCTYSHACQYICMHLFPCLPIYLYAPIPMLANIFVCTYSHACQYICMHLFPCLPIIYGRAVWIQTDVTHLGLFSSPLSETNGMFNPFSDITSHMFETFHWFCVYWKVLIRHKVV